MKQACLLACGLLGLGTLAACTPVANPLDDYEQLNPVTIQQPPASAEGGSLPAEQVDRGRYMVGLLGCGSCHSDGALIGEPVPGRLLAGSSTGIAYSNPLAVSNPGVVYPANLTPDPETGIGDWTQDAIVTMLRAGTDSHGGQTLPVMPWPAYAALTDEDAYAIAAYLQSLPPVRHQVPANVAPGQRARAPYVHFGVYRSRR